MDESVVRSFVHSLLDFEYLNEAVLSYVSVILESSAESLCFVTCAFRVPCGAPLDITSANTGLNQS